MSQLAPTGLLARTSKSQRPQGQCRGLPFGRGLALMRPSAAALGTASPSHRHGTCGDSFVGWPLPMAEDTEARKRQLQQKRTLIFWTGALRRARGLCPLCRGRVTLSSFRKAVSDFSTFKSFSRFLSANDL